MNRYGSRKFLMAVGGLIGLHWALWAGLIGAAEYKVLLPAVARLRAQEAGNE